MKKSISFFLVGSLLGCCAPSSSESESEKYPLHVGDLLPMEKDTTFRPCNEKQIFQYYNFGNGVQYDGGKPAIEEAIQKSFTVTSPGDTGYVTIRFVVTCEGKTGRFRVEGMNMGYQPKNFSAKATEQLLQLTRSLGGWQPGVDQNSRAVDYYQYLTFKLKEGMLLEILP
jgi:hypothetical protein